MAVFIIVKIDNLKDVSREIPEIVNNDDKRNKDIIKTITIKQCEEIASKKLKDLNANTVEQGVKIIVGSAKSMGIEVTG